MWPLLIYAGITTALWLYNHYTQPHTPAPIPRSRDSLNLPRTEEGSAIPLVYGRCQIKSPVLVWCSDLSSKQGPDDRFITYGLTMLFSVGIPMGAGTTQSNQLNGPLLHNVWMGDKLLPSAGILPQTGWNSPTIVNQTWVLRQNFLGGPGNGGGLVGTYQWFGGWTDQNFTSPPSRIGDVMQNSGLPSTQIPGHRRQMCVAFAYAPTSSADPYINQTYQLNGDPTGTIYPVPDGFSLGENPDLNGFAMEVSSYGDKVFSMTNPGFDFGGDADPIEVIYDLLTNAWGRLGLDVSKIDMTSFAAASATLKTENHGYSNVHYQTEDAQSVITGILQQINASMYEEPTTGKFKIKLIRFDYVVSSLPVFDESNIEDVTDFQYSTWHDTVNEVRVKFTDRIQQYSVATVVVPSLANAVGNNNRRRPKEIQYLGISNMILAAAVAARDANVLSVPLARLTMKANRDAWSLRPGDCFVVNYAKYNIAGLVFRVTQNDMGQLFSNVCTIEAVQDAFATNYAGQITITNNPIRPPTALVNRTVIECPRWVQHEAALAGLINDPDYTRLLALPVPGSGDIEFFVNSAQPNAQVGIFRLQTIDVPRQRFPTYMQVAVAYSRALEPYDTGTGLVVGNIVMQGNSTFGVFPVSANDIANHGFNLLCIVRANGEHEFVAFESATSLGGGQLRLNNVWRGLMDTPAIDHSVGEYAFVIEPSMVGRRAWSIVKPVTMQAVPSTGAVSGSGFDPIETFPNFGPTLDPAVVALGFSQQNARSFRPLPPANFTVFGEGCQGTQGIPTLGAGYFKSISLLEEGVDLIGVKRESLQTRLVRGSDGDDTLSYDAQMNYHGTCSPTGLYYPRWTNRNYEFFVSEFIRITHSAVTGGLVTYGGSPVTSRCLADLEYQFDWYGNIDFGMDASLTLLGTMPAVGKGGLDAYLYSPGGIPVNNVLLSYATPRVTAFAPSWRNLIANARFNYAFSHAGSPAGIWLDVSGSPALFSGTFSLSLAASGANSYYLGGTAAFVMKQDGFVTSWFPRGLTAIAVAYIKNSSGDVTHTGQLNLADDATGSATGSATIGALTHWLRQSTSMVMTAGSSFAQMLLSSNSANTNWTEAELRIGQFQANVLANYSFDTGSTSSWTNITNSFVVSTTIGPSVDCAQGGAFATSAIRQEYTLPTGWTGGATAFLTCFRSQSIVGDVGTVTISAVDGSGTVLTTSTTGAEALATLNIWLKRTLFCDVPDTAVKIRVDLTAVRTGGAGNSGAFFDEVALWVAKDLAPRTRKMLDFSAPTAQPMPNTFPDFTRAFPTLPLPDVLLGGTNLNEQEIIWTDQTSHPVSKFTGQFGGTAFQTSTAQISMPVGKITPTSFGVSSVDGWTFTRGSGAGATHLAAQHQQGYLLGAYPVLQSFSCAIIYTIDEQGFAAQCGLVGRMDLGQGWGLELNSSGQLTALLRGAGSTTATVSLGRVSSEGGRHLAALVYDSVANTLTVYDELGSAAATTVGLGEIKGTSSACHLRIGRDADDRDVMPGMIARVSLWSSALSSGQLAALWTYAEDPTGLITTYTRTGAAWHGVPSDAAGEVLTCSGPTQIAMPWSTQLTVNDSFNVDSLTFGSPPHLQSYKRSGYAIAVGRATSNRIQSWDTTNATFWTADGATVLTQGVVDMTGRARGVTIAGNATNGLKAIGVTVGAVARNVTLSFWARGPAGVNNLTVQLLTSTGALVTSATVSLTALWKRYDVVLAYSGATATCQWRWVSSSGSLTFDLGSVIHSSEWSSTCALVPVLIANPASTISDTTATVAQTLPLNLNAEGEIVATWTTLHDVDATASPGIATLCQINNGTNSNDRKELQITNGGTMRLAHSDGTGAQINSIATPASGSTTSAIVKARGRWNRIGLLDTNAPMFAQIALVDSAHPTLTLGGAGRTVTWTPSAVQLTTIIIGGGTGGAVSPEPCLVPFLNVQSREEKLP